MVGWRLYMELRKHISLTFLSFGVVLFFCTGILADQGKQKIKQQKEQTKTDGVENNVLKKAVGCIVKYTNEGCGWTKNMLTRSAGQIIMMEDRGLPAKYQKPYKYLENGLIIGMMHGPTNALKVVRNMIAVDKIFEFMYVGKQIAVEGTYVLMVHGLNNWIKKDPTNYFWFPLLTKWMMHYGFDMGLSMLINRFN